jgi:hypothetical protein
MRKYFTKKRVVFLAVLAIAAAGAVGGYAYWTQGGTGTGSATTGTTTAITVNQTSTTASTLYPGGPSEALSGNFTNPNSGAVHISSVTAAVAAFSSQTDVSKPACTQADFTIGGSFGPYVVPAGPGTVGAWSGLNVSLNNGAGNQDNCKSVTITIDYTANP